VHPERFYASFYLTSFASATASGVFLSQQKSLYSTMDQIILHIKDESKKDFLMELIRQLDFVEVEKPKTKKGKAKEYDFFKSAGIWEGYEIDSKELREKAWKRGN
jgi:hypothetical protein